MTPSHFARVTLIVVAALGVGLSSAVLGVGAMIGLSESHSGTPAMIGFAYFQALVAGGACVWALFTCLTALWRMSRLDFVAVAIAGLGQVCSWRLLDRYEFLPAWTAETIVLAGVAVASVLCAWVLVLSGRWPDWSNRSPFTASVWTNEE